VTITPTHDLAGTTMITLTATDSIITTTQTFTLTVVAPSISAIPNQRTQRDQPTAAIPFAIVTGDDPLAVEVTGSSSNTALVPIENIVIGGAGTNRTVTITPQPNATGTTTIILTVHDVASTASTTFNLTVGSYTIALPLVIR
jgi:hypothetical protein